jgi:hypothetical protein
MDKNEYIAEAKRRHYSDSEIQELLDIHEKLVQLGHPPEYRFDDGALSDDEIEGLFVTKVQKRINASV